jgi:demethylmenaquinone methyltransferase/2-methoxy-6-polyprenyl-1,4-benzoquinol methylase
LIAIGRQKAARRVPDDRITSSKPTPNRCPLPSDTFQIVSVAFGLRNVADTDRGLAEMVRVAAPGAVSLCWSSLRPSAAVQGDLRLVLPQRACRASASGRRNSSAALRILPESVGQFPQGEALAERMRAAGLSTCAVTRSRWAWRRFM